MFGVVISSVHFRRGFVCCSNLVFFYIDHKEKQIWLPEAVSQIIITSNKTKREPTGTLSNIDFIYNKLLQTFRKSICLVEEFFLINPFIGVFWGIFSQVSQQLPHKTPLILGVFFIILSVCCCYFVTKPLWNCVIANQICCCKCFSLTSYILEKFHNIHRKTLALEFLFDKVADLQGVFLWILRTF